MLPGTDDAELDEPPQVELEVDPQITGRWHRERTLTVSQWADRHRILDARFSNEAGTWRTSRVPHAREWMDAACSPWVRQITLMGGTQVAKSETLNNIVGYYLQFRPCPIVFVLPNEKAAGVVARRRLLPMIQASPALRAELTGRANDERAVEIALRNSVVYLRSAGSPTDLASTSAKLVVGDETEKWPTHSGDESSPLALVRERQRTFFDRLLILACTPKHRGGIIDSEFAQGDQRRFHIPCPACGKLILLQWSRVRWPAEVTTRAQMLHSRSAWYECECGARINDLQRGDACSRGLWVPAGKDPVEWRDVGQAADRCEHRSYHIWAGYSPWLSWWEIVAEFLRQKEDAQHAQNWSNSWLAEVYEDSVELTTDQDVLACVEERPAGIVPPECRVLTAAVDVQKNRLEWCVQGWGEHEESWVIDAGRIPLMPDGADWRQLADLMFRRTWGNLRVHVCLVDSRGGREDEVVDWCRDWQPHAQMIAGVERSTPILFDTKKVDRHPRTGLPLKRSLMLWTLQVGWFKDLVAARIARSSANPDIVAGRLHLPSGLPPDWLGQVCSEHKIRQRTGSRSTMRWVLRPGHLRNEAWDLLVYNAAAARMHFVQLLSAPAAPAPSHAPPVKAARKSRGPNYPRLGS